MKIFFSPGKDRINVDSFTLYFYKRLISRHEPMTAKLHNTNINGTLFQTVLFVNWLNKILLIGGIFKLEVHEQKPWGSVGHKQGPSRSIAIQASGNSRVWRKMGLGPEGSSSWLEKWSDIWLWCEDNRNCTRRLFPLWWWNLVMMIHDKLVLKRAMTHVYINK